MTQKPLLLTTKEAAAILRVHRVKLYSLIKGGVIQAVRIGTDWRIPIECIERLCAAKIPESYFNQPASQAKNASTRGRPRKKPRASIPVASSAESSPVRH